MSIIAYRPVANVSAKLKGAPAPIESVRFTPTPSTEARMASKRLVFRPYGGGFRLVAQHDLEGGGGPMVPITDPLQLLFAITSSDSEFLSRHADGAAAKAGPSIFLTNRNATGTPQGGPGLSRDETVGAKDRARIVPRVCRARVSLAGSPSRVELRPYFGGAAIRETVLEAPPGATSADVGVSVEGESGLAFTLRPKPSGQEQLIVADDELAQMLPAGVLELVLKTFPGPAPPDGREFSATFEK